MTSHHNHAPSSNALHKGFYHSQTPLRIAKGTIITNANIDTTNRETIIDTKKNHRNRRQDQHRRGGDKEGAPLPLVDENGWIYSRNTSIYRESLPLDMSVRVCKYCAVTGHECPNRDCCNQGVHTTFASVIRKSRDIEQMNLPKQFTILVTMKLTTIVTPLTLCHFPLRKTLHSHVCTKINVT